VILLTKESTFLFIQVSQKGLEIRLFSGLKLTRKSTVAIFQYGFLRSDVQCSKALALRGENQRDLTFAPEEAILEIGESVGFLVSSSPENRQGHSDPENGQIISEG
jgi:hypothetical protein